MVAPLHQDGEVLADDGQGIAQLVVAGGHQAQASGPLTTKPPAMSAASTLVIMAPDMAAGRRGGQVPPGQEPRLNSYRRAGCPTVRAAAFMEYLTRIYLLPLYDVDILATALALRRTEIPAEVGKPGSRRFPNGNYLKAAVSRLDKVAHFGHVKHLVPYDITRQSKYE